MAKSDDNTIVIPNLCLSTIEAEELKSFCQSITWRKTEHFTHFQDHRTYNLKMAFEKLSEALRNGGVK